MHTPVAVTGGFDDIRSAHLRFLEEAARLGEVTVWLWPDESLRSLTSRPPRFPLAERAYFLEAIRWVSRVRVLPLPFDPNALPLKGQSRPAYWVDDEHSAHPARALFCRQHGIQHRILSRNQIAGFPAPAPRPPTPGAKKILVTGCYDWVHSGHVRFFEEASALGNLYVVVGNDANIRQLKGEGHPLLPQDERRYLVGAIRSVHQALIASGSGWLDADAEIQRIQPDIYVVNEDGDRGGKREYCQRLGIEYRILKRTPAPGLPRRSSTDLRGF
ncbi:MAG TPA: adenylyltransferase/cytidyltransferase family protein [Candidatus Paceibacterota bacterium]|nr:adenylyltransferase/cytidyltransferase family protein [Verrucomicrobiota bacterium]HRZ47376.1 adenylyltransferase/cytidyltransferase family protein [Candidatus Paceibacterota bacterium]HRZ92208.1 adenylyltransferase/cytidyltransferase family protein [Candidatus Paceibacterota bacterium]